MSKEADLTDVREATERITASLITISSALEDIVRTLGTSAGKKVGSDLRQARAVGQFTVLSAVSELKKHAKTSEMPAPKITFEAKIKMPKEKKPSPPSCISNYVDLTAAQIVPLIASLTPEERSEVLAYEKATRERKTIIAALKKAT